MKDIFQSWKTASGFSLLSKNELLEQGPKGWYVLSDVTNLKEGDITNVEGQNDFTTTKSMNFRDTKLDVKVTSNDGVREPCTAEFGKAQ